jgi:DNA-binding NarL/FixJ family response regulator
MRVLIADDHPLVRRGLRYLLEPRGIEVVAEATNGREAVEQTKQLHPDVVLMDLRMPELGGLEATRQLAAEQLADRVLIISSTEDDQEAFEAVKCGAVGYIPKSHSPDAFLMALDAAMRGEPPVTPGLASQIIQEFARPLPAVTSSRFVSDSLTEDESDLLELVAVGVIDYRELAAQLGLTDKALSSVLRSIMEKLHARSNDQT